MMAKHSSGKPLVNAASACVFRGDEVLLIQRGKTWGRGLWSLPGGKSEAGETAQQAASRELAEETGLFVSLTHHVGDFEIEGPDVFYIISCWTGVYSAGEAVAQSDAIAVAWVRWNELRSKKLALNTLEAVERARQLLRI